MRRETHLSMNINEFCKQWKALRYKSEQNYELALANVINLFIKKFKITP